jgi:MFS family permease
VSGSGAIALARVLRDSGRVVLANRQLRRVAETWGCWIAGEWAFLVLLSVTAYDRGGTTAIAVVGVVRMVPGAVAAPLLSHIADRMPRVLVLSSVLLSWTVLAAVVPVGLLSDSLVPLYLIVGVASVTATLLRPAINALVPEVVDSAAELTAANSTYSLVEAAGSLVGPLLAGALVASLPSAPRYLVVAAAFAAAAAVSSTIKTEFQPAERQLVPSRRRLLEPLAGFAALLRPPRLRVVFLVIMAQTTTRGLLNVLVVATAVSLLRTGLSSTGLLFAALGAGGLLGALVTLLGASWRPGLPFILGMAAWGVPLTLVAAWPNELVAWLALAVVGFGNAVGDVFGFTLMHRLIPDHVLGRAFGAFWGMASATQALGAIIAARLITGVGVRGSFLAVGVAMTVIPLTSWLVVRRIDADLSVDEHTVSVLHRCALLAPLTRVALEQLARHATPLEVAAGSAVIEQGAPGRTFYVVDSGSLDARVDEVEVRRLGADDCFGEIAAMRDVPRTATVVAREPTRLLALEAREFVLAVTGHRLAEQAALSMVKERVEPRTGQPSANSAPDE